MSESRTGVDPMMMLVVEVATDLVTVREYREFCEATNRDPGKALDGRPNQPVVNVSWYDCMDYAEWYSKKTGKLWRLPLVEELKAAEALCPEDADFSAWPLPELPDIGQHPETNNALGVRDLVGCVYQWTLRPEDAEEVHGKWQAYLASAEYAEWAAAHPQEAAENAPLMEATNAISEDILEEVRQANLEDNPLGIEISALNDAAQALDSHPKAQQTTQGVSITLREGDGNNMAGCFSMDVEVDVRVHLDSGTIE